MHRPVSFLFGVLFVMSAGLAGCQRSTGELPPALPPLEQPPLEQPPQAPPPQETENPQNDQSQPEPTIRLVFVGDIMLDRVPGQAVERGEDPFAALAEVLHTGDVTVGNLECVIATVGQKVPKLYNFRCHPRNVPLLARYFDAVSVANNHSGDYGKEAFVEQLGLLSQGGLRYFGGGLTDADAHAPLILEAGGIRVALLGYNEIELRSYEAGPDRPGLAWSDDARVVADIAAAKAGADLVVVYPHWGNEYQPVPSERQVSLARKMVDAGADLVVGGHPHVIQTAAYYKDRLIVYSLGNFVFDDFNDVPASLGEPSRMSWVLRVTLSRQGMVEWDTLVARTDDSGIPRLVRGAESPCGKAVSKEIGTCRTD
ncbi:MAG TPA: CapA family protein [Symbiobacteriaceae bacterium]|nr:CapA family protein [Symbiobacteriaceae bacterium]